MSPGHWELHEKAQKSFRRDQYLPVDVDVDVDVITTPLTLQEQVQDRAPSSQEKVIFPWNMRMLQP